MWRRRSGIVVAALVVTVPAAALAVTSGIDGVATLVPGRHQLTITGSGPACSPGDRVSIAVRVQQGSRTASGRSATRDCRRVSAHWRVLATTADNTRLRPGAATVHATATTARGAGLASTERWDSVVTLQCPQPARTPQEGELARFTLRRVSSDARADGLVRVVRHHGHVSIEIDVRDIKPNTTTNAYGVWLNNPAADSRLLGFVNPGVGRDRRLQAGSEVPNDTGCFRRLVVSLETSATPKHPHHLVLVGNLKLG